MKNIILISGKAESGKNLIGSILQKHLSNTLITAFGDYVKYVCQTYLGWNGVKDQKGRDFIQFWGTDIVRKENYNFWALIISQLHFVLRNQFDYFITPDTRFPNEIEEQKLAFGNKVLTLKVVRPNHISKLTEEQKNHISETGLDNYEFDYTIINDGSIEDLEKKVEIFIERFIKDD
jgi:phosphomevalonate kinase